MDREEQARQAKSLRRAMAVAGLTNHDLATALGVSPRTITNWRDTSGTMPNEAYQESLRQLLPGYGDEGDPVEVALARTELDPWRQTDVLAVYKRHLHEQSREDKALG